MRMSGYWESGAYRASMPIRCCATSRTRRGLHVDIAVPPPYPPPPVFLPQLGYNVRLVLATRLAYPLLGCCRALKPAPAVGFQKSGAYIVSFQPSPVHRPRLAWATVAAILASADPCFLPYRRLSLTCLSRRINRLSHGLGRNLARCPTCSRRKTLFHDRPRPVYRLHRSTTTFKCAHLIPRRVLLRLRRPPALCTYCFGLSSALSALSI